jgi:hypothetical protein
MKARAAQVFIDVLRTASELTAGTVGYTLRAGTTRGYANILRNMDIAESLLRDTDSSLRNRTGLNKHLEFTKEELKEKGLLERLSHGLASAPETMLVLPVWYGRFQSEFKAATGKEFNAQAYKNNEAYRRDNRAIIRDSAAIADGVYERVAGSATQFGERRRVQVLPTKAAQLVGSSSLGTKDFFGKAASFMTGYPHREWLQFADSMEGLYEAMKEGEYEGRDVDVARLMIAPMGILANVLIYNYMRQMQFALTNLLSADDDDEKEKAQEELSELLSARGLWTETYTGLASLAATKYSGAGRQLLKAAGSLAYNLTDDKTDEGKQLRADIRAMTRNLTFQEPYVTPSGKFMVREGLYRTAGEAIPAFATAVDNYTKLITSYQDFDKMRKRLESGQPLNQEEQEAVVALAFGLNVFNAIGQHFGLAVPATFVNRLSRKYTPSGRKGRGPAGSPPGGPGGGPPGRP